MMKFCKYMQFNLPLVMSLLGLILLGAHQASGRSIKVTSNTKIMFEKYDAEYFRLNHYLQTADNLTSLLLHSRQNVNLLLRIIVVDKKKMKQDINIVQAGKSINIYINSDFERWQHKPVVNKLMLSTLLFAKCDIRTPKGSLPDWLLTGLYAELKYKTSKKISSPSTYLPGIMALVRAGKIPKLSMIISHPVKKRDGEVYKLYEAFCRFMLNISEKLCRHDKATFTEIAVLSATGNYTQQEIFSSTIGRIVVKRYGQKIAPSGNDDKIIRQWFRRMLINQAANYFFPLSAKAVDKKFSRLFPIKCAVKVGNEKYKAVSLTLLQLPEYWNRIKQPFALRSALKEQLMLIIRQAPIAISKPLYTINTAISVIGKDPPGSSRRALKAALIDYHKALIRQVAIENYLGDIEQRDKYMTEYYNRQLKIIGKAANNPWPAMAQYLDRAENKLLQ